jgi:hypothetical protein
MFSFQWLNIIYGYINVHWFHISNCKSSFFKIQIAFDVYFSFMGFWFQVRESKFLQKEIDFFLMNCQNICWSSFPNLWYIDFINFSNQKVGLNMYFSIGFKCTFYIFWNIHLFLIFLELDFYKINRKN